MSVAVDSISQAPKVIEMVPVASIVRGDNDRLTFNQAELEGLAGSIKKLGCMSPPVLRRLDIGYRITIGERRFRAMTQVLGWTKIPAIVETMTDQEEDEKMLAENLKRVDLDVIEEAKAYRKRIDKYALSVADIAFQAHVSVSRVRERLALLKLLPEIQTLVSAKHMTLAAAACLEHLDNNRQLLAMRAWRNDGSKRPISIDEFRFICGKLLADQQQDSIFDTASFLQVEEYRKEAKDAVALNTTVERDAIKAFVGPSEIAERFGVKRTTVNQWVFRNKLPAPAARISGNPVWRLADIIRWNNEREAE